MKNPITGYISPLLDDFSPALHHNRKFVSDFFWKREFWRKEYKKFRLGSLNWCYFIEVCLLIYYEACFCELHKLLCYDHFENTYNDFLYPLHKKNLFAQSEVFPNSRSLSQIYSFLFSQSQLLFSNKADISHDILPDICCLVICTVTITNWNSVQNIAYKDSIYNLDS